MQRRIARWAAGVSAVALVGAWVRTVVLPSRPDDARLPIPRRIPDADARPSPDGDGVRIVVNPSSGPAWSASPTDALRQGLPGADIHELSEDDDLAARLAGDDLLAVGAAGGDGTLSAVALIAADRDLPFVVVPAGTRNHLARDLGLATVDDAIRAVQAGTTTRMDIGVAGDRSFVNTLSFGGYTQVVDARERMERHLGKWPALLVALLRELPKMEPLQVELDGRRMRVWLAWIGNGKYDPTGFGPLWRERLDDGLLDVRIVNGAKRFSRTRFVVDVLTGRLSSCPVYEERSVPSLSIRSLEGPLRLAADGETYDGPAELEVTKRRRALQVAVPPQDPRDDEPASARPAATAPTTRASTPAPVTQTPPSS